MIKKLTLLHQCIFGPKLYQIYPRSHLRTENRGIQQRTQLYSEHILEVLSDNVFLFFDILHGIFRIIWPFCLFYIFYRRSLTYENILLILPIFICFLIVPVYFMILRGICRFINPVYRNFAQKYIEVKYSPTNRMKEEFLSNYDFSVSHWKSDYIVNPALIHNLPKQFMTNTQPNTRIASSLIKIVLHYSSLLLSYACINLFGRHLMFPGSLKVVYHMRRHYLLMGRRNLTTCYNGKRKILQTADGNRIDTMFVNARSSKLGQILIIPCEGNAGFYEVGPMVTAIKAGYSVLGWNRPGFAESSGSPGPQSEINSIDAVMSYAIKELHFPVENIILFAWSIGGYAACWAAVHYPDICGLILDAVFDDVLPLAQKRMPLFTSKFVEKSIRYYLNLNNIELLKLYNGPIQLIRRTNDEIMNMVDGQFQSNRINDIVLNILPYRYPNIYNDDETKNLLRKYIYAVENEKEILLERYCFNENVLIFEMDKYRTKQPVASYPCNFGERFTLNQRQSFAIYFADKYLLDFHSNHCTSLPQRYFSMPIRMV